MFQNLGDEQNQSYSLYVTIYIFNTVWDFPGGPMVKTLHF